MYKITIKHILALSIAVYPLSGNADFASLSPAPDSSFRTSSPEKVELGRMLMFDKILSGNKNISCGTCHHSLAGTGDGLSLPVGEGGVGVGITRNVGEHKNRVVERVPRNAPALWNLGHVSFQTMFHDGRVSNIGGEGSPSGCVSPAGDNLPDTLESVLACQAMFPVTSGTEMAGQAGENRIANAAADGDLVKLWELLAKRLRAIPEYVDMFTEAFPEVVEARDINFAHAANAIAAFEQDAWRADNSPFDRYLRGEPDAMSKSAKDGMALFYNGKGKSKRKGNSDGQACAACHSGIFQTDNDFHAIAMPQIGGGRGSGPFLTEDYGREQVTGHQDDRLKFRTPSLRNVALNAPYGHSGAYNSLRAVVEHHLDPVNSLYGYIPQAILPTHPLLDGENYIAMDDEFAVDTIAINNELVNPVSYSELDIDKIMDFLYALTDQSSLDLRHNLDVVRGVPSGLPLAE